MSFNYKIKDNRCFIYKNGKLDYSFTMTNDEPYEIQAERRTAERQGIAFDEERAKRIYEAGMIRGEVSIDDVSDLRGER